MWILLHPTRLTKNKNKIQVGVGVHCRLNVQSEGETEREIEGADQYLFPTVIPIFRFHPLPSPLCTQTTSLMVDTNTGKETGDRERPEQHTK